MFQAIDSDSLRRLESQFCRSIRRSDWWQLNSEHPSQGLGRIVENLREFRMSLNMDPETLSQERLRSMVTRTLGQEFAIGSFSLFLKGEQKHEQWLVRAKVSVEIILNGDAQASDGDRERNSIAQRIVEFFFPVDIPSLLRDDRYQEKWFFSARSKGIREPATRSEAEAELRALAYDAKDDPTNGYRIIRVSGGRRFPVGRK